ncbi:MAG TPA: M1 family aminopeptidase [Polyangiaceae bacterium]|nr:M1 family aminopeptidase [Polyangiaceae bacterium]
MLLQIAAFELSRRRRMLSSYVYVAVLFAFGLMSMLASGGAFASVAVGVGSDRVHANAPELLHGLILSLSHFGLIITAAVFGQAVHQDVETGFAPILLTTGVGKLSYLGGRFVGALGFMALLFTSIGLGLWVGSLMPFLDRSLFGPNRLDYYAWPYLVSVLPNLLLTGAIFFSLAALLRSMTPVYVAGVVLLVGYLMTAALFADPEDRALAAMVDPLGSRACDLATRYWTASERNTLLVPLKGALLQNRGLWLGFALGLLAWAFRRYRFGQVENGGRPRASQVLDEPLAAARPGKSFGPRTVPPARNQLASIWLLASSAFREIVESVYFGVFVLAGALFVGVTLTQLESIFGTPTYPVSRALIELVGGAFVPFVLVIIAFYSGELTFRERDARIDSVFDALPLPDYLPFVSKLLALMLVPVALQCLTLLGCIAVQAAQGYHHYELGLYLEALFGLRLIDHWLLCVLCLAIHAVLQHKYLGHFVIVLYYVARLFSGQLGLQHNLYLYGGVPGHRYSDMNGYGHLLRGVHWFHGYWALGALLLAIVTRLAWQRGAETSLAVRWRIARERWTPRLRLATAAAAAAMVLAGAYIFYNTNVLNHYETDHDREQKRAEYERLYKPLQGKPQPRITDVAMDVDVFPETTPPSLRARGTYALRNQGAEPIEAVYVTLPEWTSFDLLRVGSTREPTRRDAARGFYTFELERPLQPGETTELQFDIPHRPRGFTNEEPPTAIVNNGTFYSSFDEQPVIGYQKSRELALDNARKNYGLAPREGMADPSDMRARMNTYVSSDADWVNFRANVSTAADQIALAPGYLQREWTEGGRRHFEYAMDSPILNLFSVQSARYQVKRDRWRDVVLEIYYHAGHEFDLERMMQGMKDALGYCSSQFGPYQHRQLRIVEFPRYQRFAASFPNTVPYSEAIGFIAKVDPTDTEDVDYPYYVTAHEVAHQWWAHQAIGGDVQGATMLSESMSQYTALMVMKAAFGEAKMKRFLRYELDRYLTGRGLERRKEVPLARVEEQDYIYYSKGSLAMFALQDYIGEEKVNRAARAFLDAVKFQRPPYTTSLELLGFIRQQAPPELAYLIDDMFENITLFDNRATSAKYRKLADGRYELKLALSVSKRRADELGTEHDVPLSDLVEVGVLDEEGVAVALEKRWVDTPNPELTLILAAPPALAGVDPLNKLIDRNPSDNVVRALEVAEP